MPIDPVKIALEVQGGTSAVCATCTHFWDAKDKGSASCGQACGGPISGNDFPRYNGPMTDLSRWCFMCGANAVGTVRVSGRSRLIGICQEHVRSLDELTPASGAKPHYVVTGVDRVNPTKTKSLVEAIYEVEKYYADKEGREL